MQHLLESRVSEHMENCFHNPVFSIAANTDSPPNLMISCQVWQSPGQARKVIAGEHCLMQKMHIICIN